jgi:hypothetical protein
MRAPDEMKAAPPAASTDEQAGTAATAGANADIAGAAHSASAPGSGSGEAGPVLPALHKQVERYRPWYRRERRAAAGLIVISMGTIGASAGLFTWTAGSRPARHVEEPSLDLDAIDKDPIPGRLATELSTARLAADDAIGEPVDRVPVADGAPAVRGLAAAADGYGVIAVWTDRVVWVSRDDGRSFRQELAAPGPVSAVAVGRDGRVYAARHGRIGMLSPAGHTRWHDLDAGQVLAIAAAPPRELDPAAPAAPGWLAVLALHDDHAAGAAPLLWLSDDDGETWRSLIAPHHGDAANRIWVSPDGVIDLLTEDTDGSVGSDTDEDLFGAGAWRHRHYRARAEDYPLALVFAGDAPAPFAMGHDGLRWRLAWDGDQLQLAADQATAGAIVGPDRAVGGVVPVRNWDVRVAAGAHRTLAVADGRLLDLGRGAPRVVTRQVPGGVDTLAVDGIGRAVATVGGSALRYSPRHGWRRLFEIPPR